LFIAGQVNGLQLAGDRPRLLYCFRAANRLLFIGRPRRKVAGHLHSEVTVYQTGHCYCMPFEKWTHMSQQLRGKERRERR